MNKKKRADYCEQAKSLRLQADKLRQEADKLWNKHVELLRKVYPEPKSEHQIQVTINCNSGSSSNLFSTSFPGISEYKQAQQQLGWPYGLCTEQVKVCEQCDEFYIADKGVKYYDLCGVEIEFCTSMCLRDVEIKQETNDLEYMMECFPDQYEYIDGKIRAKAPSPELQKAFHEAWKRTIEYQAKKRKP